jgi:hypothetical protein
VRHDHEGKVTVVKARFKVFPGVFKSWEEICEKVAAFVDTVGPERLITIAHTADPGVIVWYWEVESSESEPQRRKHG